jgi:hypothetical protein
MQLGTVPSLMDLLIISARGTDISGATDLSSLAFILFPSRTILWFKTFDNFQDFIRISWR